MITYTDYPSLLFTSYGRLNAPLELPIQVESDSVKLNLSSSDGFKNLFGIIPILNDLGENKMNFWLPDNDFHRVEYDQLFRQKHFSRFIVEKRKVEQYGVINFKNRGQYVYLFLPKSLSKNYGFKEDYLCTALFNGNFFLGFEETLILSKGISVLQTGIYSSGMDIGGYISFTSICLDFFSTKNLKDVPKNINLTSEKIYSV